MATELTELGKLFKSTQEREAATLLSQKTRKAQVESIYSDIIKRYEPGGAFGAGYESLIQRQKTRDVGATAQRDISRGLYGIRPYEAEWEATTGASARLKLEDIRMERLSGAQTGMAGFLERIEEPYPDYSSLFQAAQAQGQGYSIPRRQATSGTAAPRQSLSDWLTEFAGSGSAGYGVRPGQAYTPEPGKQGTLNLAGRGGTSGGQGLIDPSQIVGGDIPGVVREGGVGTGGSVDQPTQVAQTAPATASLMSRYHRWQRQFKRQNPNIAEGNIASYENWYNANIRNK